jgi:hypothetical protein
VYYNRLFIISQLASACAYTFTLVVVVDAASSERGLGYPNSWKGNKSITPRTPIQPIKDDGN